MNYFFSGIKTKMADLIYAKPLQLLAKTFVLPHVFPCDKMWKKVQLL